MSQQINHQIVLAKRPSGKPESANFRLEASSIPAPEDGQVLCKTIFLSLDPYMRGRMNEGKSYAPPVEIDEVMGGGTVGQVIESKNSELDFVCFNLEIKNSTASVVPIGFKIRRST